jgi:hypothetical protein
MAESLEDFLGLNKSTSNIVKINGSLSCRDCNEIVAEGELNEDTRILSFICSVGHKSEVSV